MIDMFVSIKDTIVRKARGLMRETLRFILVYVGAIVFLVQRGII